MDSRNIRYSKGPALNGSIGFTLKRTNHKPYTNMNIKDYPPFKALLELKPTQQNKKITKHIILEFYRLRDKESAIGCYDCENEIDAFDFCHCGPICENCSDKYCSGCGFHREDYY